MKNERIQHSRKPRKNMRIFLRKEEGKKILETMHSTSIVGSMQVEFMLQYMYIYIYGCFRK